MKKYTIKFMPEYNATSLWSVSDSAYEDLGIGIKYKRLNLSEELIEKLEKFDESIMGLIDWDNPGGESPLSYDEREALWKQGQILLEEIRIELGEDFEVTDESDWIK